MADGIRLAFFGLQKFAFDLIETEMKKIFGIYKQFGKSLRQYRKAAGLTQTQLAKKAKLSLNFCGQIERSSKKASLETVGKLAKALQIPVSKLFTFKF